ncbi:MAG TPA: hydrolase [Desulfosporosinus sp.]|nr:hydrolase [Desulfosporosinus sp.]
MLGGGAYYYQSTTSVAYIIINGETIGIAPNVDSAQNLIDKILADKGAALGVTAKTDDKIEYSTGRLSNGDLKLLSEENLNEKLAVYIEGNELTVANNPIFVLPSQEESNKLLKSYQEIFAQSDETNQVTSVSFQEEIGTNTVSVSPERVITYEQALEKLKRGNVQKSNYTIQPNDSWWLIARKNDLKISEVLAANPGATPYSVLKPGQTINIEKVSPYLTVVSKGTRTDKEIIPFEEVEKIDTNLASGQTKIIKAGSDGEKEIKYIYEQKNDKVITKTIVDEKVIKDSVPQVVAKGPKREPVVVAYSRGSDSSSSALISRAMSLQGVPYLWGGTTRAGFDCSGFVQYVFKASGVSLPRTSFEQYKVGTPVSRDQLKPGDLVFFTTYKPGASDVRIYMGGGRTIGSASEGVGIHSLSESYWSKRYIGARRVF